MNTLYYIVILDWYLCKKLPLNTTTFILDTAVKSTETLKASWQAPSNIALVKYWGKHGMQLPANPSISLTLNNCKTSTTVQATRKKHGFTIAYEGKEKPSFAPKIRSFLDRIKEYSPWITDYFFKIDTTNTFPHSSGIASSASSMAALSACIIDMESQLTGKDLVYDKMSFLARLGSGSACRSIKGSAVLWGKHNTTNDSTDLIGIDKSSWLHPVFQDYQDTILLVDRGEKTVSSTLGHGLMDDHAFAKARYHQAHSNLTALEKALKTGDLEQFIKITESEALTLHAMMMSSHPYFILMKPNTLSIINELWAYRKETGIPVCFTLDAGANVHMLYPKKHKDSIQKLINSKLAGYCDNSQYICDEVGNGAQPVTD